MLVSVVLNMPRYETPSPTAVSDLLPSSAKCLVLLCLGAADFQHISTIAIPAAEAAASSSRRPLIALHC